MTKTKSPETLAAHGALERDGLGHHVASENIPQHRRAQTIKAALAGDNRCEAEGMVANGAAPVLVLCRLLIEAGHDRTTPLDVYRGDMLALRVRSIGDGAKLRVITADNGRPVFAWDSACSVVTASLVRKNRRAPSEGVSRHEPGSECLR